MYCWHIAAAFMSFQSSESVVWASRLVIFSILYVLQGYVPIVPFLVSKGEVGIILSTQAWASVAALIPGFSLRFHPIWSDRLTKKFFWDLRWPIAPWLFRGRFIWRIMQVNVISTPTHRLVARLLRCKETLLSLILIPCFSLLQSTKDTSWL